MNIYSFSKLGNHGRTGNALFQIAATVAIAAKNKGAAIFPPWAYQFAFKNELNTGGFPTEVFKETGFEYNEININRDIDLLGYFQSEKYFKGYEGLIRKQLTFKRSFINEAKIGLEDAFKKETIAIHIRRGDYMKEPFKSLYYQLPVTWFIKALFTIENWQEKNIIIFSDDIDFCKFHFDCLDNVYFSKDKSDIQDLCLISLCDEHIISNSTFSWWGAYLSKQKKVIHSGQLFAGEFLNKNIKDFYPESWVKYWPLINQLDLSDTTFTVPVFFDHDDRKRNIDLSVCILQHYFKTNIIVGEQGGSKFGYFQQWGRYVKFDYNCFHRTKMLNEMAKMSETPFIVNWDCDIIIRPLQLWLAMDKLRNGADMVFPYDGRFMRIARKPYFGLLSRDLSLAPLTNVAKHGQQTRKVPENSVGGAVMFNKKSFIEGGMENENMISFGPEDCERNDRFTKLGYKVERVPGPLFHIDHFCGTNSSIRNYYFKANHAELEKERAMSKEQLKGYVNGWKWLGGKSDSKTNEIKQERQYKIKAIVTIDEKEVILYDQEINDELSKWYHSQNSARSVKTIIHIKK